MPSFCNSLASGTFGAHLFNAIVVVSRMMGKTNGSVLTNWTRTSESPAKLNVPHEGFCKPVVSGFVKGNPLG